MKWGTCGGLAVMAVLSLTFLLQVCDSLQLSSRARRQTSDSRYMFPPKILDAMSKKGTAILLRNYKQAWLAVRESKEVVEGLSEECRERVTEIKDAIKSENEVARDLECLPCVRDACADRIQDCLDARNFELLPPNCAQAADTLHIENEEDKRLEVNKLCSFYERECGAGSSEEDCLRSVKDKCLTRFEECAIERTPQDAPTCADLSEATDQASVAFLCSYYRRECPSDLDAAGCKEQIADKCLEKIQSCGPCSGKLNEFLCEVIGMGADIKQFFRDDFSTFFKEDVSEFFKSSFARVKDFFDEDFSDFFTDDVTHFFAEDVTTFFEEDVSNFFRGDLVDAMGTFSDRVQHEMGHVEDFFDGQADTAGRFIENAWEGLTDFGDDVQDMLSEDVGDALDELGEKIRTSEIGTKVGNAFEKIGGDITDASGKAIDAVGSAFEKVGDKLTDWFGKRRKRSVDATQYPTYVSEPQCDEVTNSVTRGRACVVYRNVCPCQFKKTNVHLPQLCPSMVQANTTYLMLKRDNEWLLSIPKDQLKMTFKSFQIDKEDKDEKGHYGAVARVKIANKESTFATRIGLNRQSFQAGLPRVLNKAIQTVKLNGVTESWSVTL